MPAKKTKKLTKRKARSGAMGCGLLPGYGVPPKDDPLSPERLKAAEAMLLTRNVLKTLEQARQILPARWRDRQLIMLLKGNAEGTKAIREMQAYAWVLATVFKDERLSSLVLDHVRDGFKALGMDLNYEIA